LKEFADEGNRAQSLLVELQRASSPVLSNAFAEYGGSSAAALLLSQWMRSPDAFVGDVRHDLDCNSDQMVSKMEFRRWSKDGVLIALLSSIARARTPVSIPSSELVVVSHTDAHIPAAATAAAAILPPAPAAVAHVCSSAPAPPPPPPPDCPYVQWTAVKARKSNGNSVSISAQPDAGDALVVMKGPAFSDRCEEFYQKWRLDVRGGCSSARPVAGCDDASAVINFITMEIQGKSIGICCAC
jgi:hypothetical protein